MANKTSSENYRRLIATLQVFQEANTAYAGSISSAVSLINSELAHDDAAVRIGNRISGILPRMKKIDSIINEIMPGLKQTLQRVEAAEEAASQL